MSDIVVVDTDVVSFGFGEKPIYSVYQSYLKDKYQIVSFMTIAELYKWAVWNKWGDKRRNLLNEYMSTLLVHESSAAICEIWARITFEAKLAGRPLNPADAWIASTALTLDCILVTHNAKDFKHINGLEIFSASN